MTGLRTGRVTSVSPLEVQGNGDPTPQPARAMDDFTGATADPDSGTEVLFVNVGGRRYAWRVRS